MMLLISVAPLEVVSWVVFERAFGVREFAVREFGVRLDQRRRLRLTPPPIAPERTIKDPNRI